MAEKMMRGVKVELKSDFSVIRETLERIGIVNKIKKVITPSCYIIKDNGEFFVCHFKELLSMFDDVPDKLSEKDTNRRNSIATLLENWNLIKILDNNVYQKELKENVYVHPHKERSGYTINHKFKSFSDLKNLDHGVRCY